MLPPLHPGQQGLQGHLAGASDDGLRRATPPHGHDDRPMAGRDGHAGDVSRNGGLGHALPGPDHRERGGGEGWFGHGGVEAEVRAEVGDAPGQGHRGELHPGLVAEHGLVREVEDAVGP